jgi:hypothetical protein
VESCSSFQDFFFPLGKKKSSSTFENEACVKRWVLQLGVDLRERNNEWNPPTNQPTNNTGGVSGGVWRVLLKRKAGKRSPPV